MCVLMAGGLPHRTRNRVDTGLPRFRDINEPVLWFVLLKGRKHFLIERIGCEYNRCYELPPRLTALNRMKEWRKSNVYGARLMSCAQHCGLKKFRSLIVFIQVIANKHMARFQYEHWMNA